MAKIFADGSLDKFLQEEGEKSYHYYVPNYKKLMYTTIQSKRF